MEPPLSSKRSQSDENGPPSKKIKTIPEVPALYSDAVRRKLAATSRTGQACDRCKERKMKCDTDPTACQPCRQKGLPCYTTDRVTGHSRERGQSDRAENEVHFLREQLAAYRRKHGPLQHDEFKSLKDTLVAEPSPSTRHDIPSAKYVGWPTSSDVECLYSGPVNGTLVDVLDGVVDVAAFDCEMMQDYPADQLNKFNLSRTSIVNTMYGHQRIIDPKLPSKEEALRETNHFLVIMSQYIPIVHRPSFIELVNRFYDQPNSVSIAERVQVVVVLAIMSYQTALRNHLFAVEKFEESHRWLHYGLSFYKELSISTSIDAMQAMALIVVHFRNLPKPGYTWGYSHSVLVKAINLNYHRHPDQIELPPNENNPLSKELRKRIFHTILGVCVTTGTRVGLLAPWHFQHIDLPLPATLRDADISSHGIISKRPDLCDYWPCLQLAKLLPLLAELHSHIIAVRRPETDYLQTVEALNKKINAWRQDWDESIKSEPKQVNLQVATLLIESWAAEYQLNLYHPSVCTSNSPDIVERNLDICHKSAKRLLQAFHTLSSKYKGVDFTWHSTAAYAMGFGITLYVHRRRKSRVTPDQLETMKNELKGWMSLMAYADVVLRTGNHLQRLFQPRVRSLEAEWETLLQDVPINGGLTSLSQNSFASINVAAPQTQIKAELSPRSDSHTTYINGISQQTPQHDPVSMTSVVNPSTANPHGWPTPFQYLPQGSGPPPYPTYPQPAPQCQQVPTSLAPLLNHPNSMYMNYSNPAQARAVPTDASMTFSPNHYYDGPGTLMWPLITMPTSQQ